MALAAYIENLREAGLGSELVEPQTPYTSTWFARIVQALPPKIVKKTLAKLPNEFFLHDEQARIEFIVSEEFANALNILLLTQPVCVPLREKLEGHLDHGINHGRRVEKRYKYFLSKDQALRGSEHFRYFAPSAFLAIRLHDDVLAYTGVKDYHGDAAALFAFGFLAKVTTPMAEEDWEKIRCATAFICQHHSMPEELLSLDVIHQFLFDPVEALSRVKSVAAKQGKDIYTFFPPYTLIRDIIEVIEADATLPHEQRKIKQPVFSDKEIDGIIKQARVFAAADKLDSNDPADLSANRTILTVPDRPLFVPMEGTFTTVRDELSAIIEQAKSGQSRCDLNRWLFEVTRGRIFEGASPVISSEFRRVFMDKMAFLKKAVPAFLSGDFDPFLKVYNRLDREVIEALFVKASLSRSQTQYILNIADPTVRQVTAYDVLVNYSECAQALQKTLSTIEEERQRVHQALQYKYGLLGTMRADRQTLEQTINHLRALLNEAERIQRTKLLPYPIPLTHRGSVTPHYATTPYYWQTVVIDKSPQRYGIIFPGVAQGPE